MVIPRAYGPWDLRQERTRFSVFSEDDFRRAINAISIRGASGASIGAEFGCEIVLCGPIYPTAGFTIPATCNGLSIRATGRIPIVPSGVLPFLFEIHARGVTLRDLLVEQRDTSSYAVAFATTAGEDAKNLLVDACILNCDQLLADTSSQAQSVKITDTIIAQVSGASAAIIESGAFFGQVLGCQFSSTASSVAIKLDATAKAWRIVGNHGFVGSTATSIDTSASVGNNKLAANTGFTPVTIAASDLDDDAALQANAISGVGGNQVALGNTLVGGGLVGLSGVATANLTSNGSGVPQWTRKISSAPQSITLNTAGPSISPGDFSVFRVTHGVSASGIVTIAAGTGGQILVLVFVTVAGTAVYTDGSGNLQLSASFTPTASDTLTLIYDTASATWIEIARSAN